MAGGEAERPGEALLEAVRAEQVRMLYADGATTYLSTLVISGVLVAVLLWQGALAPFPAALWLVAMTLQSGARMGLRAAYLRAGPADRAWRRWADRFVIGMAASGLTWAGGLPWLLAPGRVDLQALVMGTLLAGTYGIIGSAGAYRPAFYMFFLPFTSAIPWFALQGDTLHLAIAGILLLWLPTVALMGRRYNASLVEAVTLRFENAALAEDLRAQKQVAEQSSLAKSRFLAAASHDLRQPVHALAMFIGALRSHRLPRRSADLVDLMDASISALDGLFTSLLDISRLDAGLVEGRPGPIAMQPMLARICRELEPEAEAKGLDLILVPTTAWVRSDPVLLERVMRNLIGNAVRYTEEGWVLVGCRRRGRQISLEVRDSGPGIPPDLHEAVFEEFYQVSNPERDRGKGLGLGLAIVRRLTDLLQHPLEMESAPGRGAAFRVVAPRATAPRGRAVPAALAARIGSGPGGVVLAIDDEVAIRAAMEALLTSWGYRVVTAAGGAEAVAAVADRGAPGVIICDHRLREGETGVEAIAAIEAAAGRRIPAILITGDTAPENIRQAQASGYPVLHKPVSHARLRAAVANLMRGEGPRRAAPARKGLKAAG